MTIPAIIGFSEATGLISVETELGALHELDMLPQDRWPRPEQYNEMDLALEELDPTRPNPAELGSHLTRWAHLLDPQGRFDDSWNAPAVETQLSIGFAPALIYRKRSKQALLRIYRDMQLQIAEARAVPTGLASMVTALDAKDYDFGPSGGEGVGAGSSGAGEAIEPLLPLAANDEQIQLVDRVSRRRNTVVQGPPGTGKTHTIANLLSHLLAHGNRVLITAATDRALKEVRGKLPEPLRELLVSAVGTGRGDLDALGAAVRAIDEKAQVFNLALSQEQANLLRRRRNELFSREAELRNQMIDLRAKETETFEPSSGWSGTPDQLAKRVVSEQGRHGWLPSLLEVPARDCEIAGTEVLALVELAFREKQDRKDDLSDALPALGLLPDAEQVSRWCSVEKKAAAAVECGIALQTERNFGPAKQLDLEARQELVQAVGDVRDRLALLRTRSEAWVEAAMEDLLVDRAETWRRRRDTLRRDLGRVERLGEQLSGVTVNGMRAEWLESAQNLRTYLEEGGKFREGFFAPGPIRAARELLQTVRVDGTRPTTAESLKRLERSLERDRILDEAEKIWPADLEIPAEDTAEERLAWQLDETRVLDRVLEAAERIGSLKSALASNDLVIYDWRGGDELDALLEVLRYQEVVNQRASVEKPLRDLEMFLREQMLKKDISPLVEELANAVQDRSAARYVEVRRKIADLSTRQLRSQELEKEIARLQRMVRGLTEALQIAGIEERSTWGERASSWDQAMGWLRTREWLAELIAAADKPLSSDLDGVENEIGLVTASLTAELAWQHALARLGTKEIQSLRAYAMALKKLGKGTGKYAAHREREARNKLEGCRNAVPAWVMPIYRLASTLSVQPHAFDVVIIDEASQAGLEAAFLQYLAPRIVVVGDDKQVSPSGIGVDYQVLINLRQRLLSDVDHGDMWEDPRTSFFDQAKLRYGDMITLREHFRCMPEIIEFSSRIAYEPEKIRLVPLRQFGQDRLPPVRTVHVPGGFENGTSHRISNLPEAEALVEQVVKCTQSPEYEGKTMGVIVMTGFHQAQVIQNLLMERLEPQEVTRRRLRCGNAVEFQGSERDVIFLSMVKGAPEKGSTLRPVTRSDQVQRYNVAVSRARDQLWLFHTPRLKQMSGRPEDLRRLLLEHCLRHSAEGNDLGSCPPPVSETDRVEPFDSLFEQHVFNELVQRGYCVIPQFEVHGRRIDLVIVGGSCRLAVECDGDRWHGLEQYSQDLVRQRELERCGWEFFRIRASAFYADRYRALNALYDLLATMGIGPAVSDDSSTVETASATRKFSTQSEPDKPLLSGPEVSVMVEVPAVLHHAETKVQSAEPDVPAINDMPGAKEAMERLKAEDEKLLVEREKGSVTAGSLQDPGPVKLDEQPISTEKALRDLILNYEGLEDDFQGIELETAGSSPVELPVQSTTRDEMPSEAGPQKKPAMAQRIELLPCPEVPSLEVPDATQIGPSEFQPLLHKLIREVGPATPGYLFRSLVLLSGRKRIGRLIQERLETALHALLENGEIVTTAATAEAPLRNRTVHLSGDEPVRLREKGDRELDQIPIDEIGRLLGQIRRLNPGYDEEATFRQLLQIYGLKRLTEGITKHLRWCWDLEKSATE